MSTVLDVARRRAWRLYAARRRGFDRRGPRSALKSFGAPNRHDRQAWNVATASHFAHYRLAHPPAEGRVAVVCVSIRAHLMPNVVTNFCRQVDVDAELIFVPNDPSFSKAEVLAAFAGVERVSIVWPSAPTTIGEGLNLGIDATDARFVAKFDDDDQYGPNYLVDALRAHRYVCAGVVGKHSYYVDLDDRDDRFLRFPAHEFAYSSTLAGGTLVIDRERTGDLAFEGISLGEDRAFVAACHRRGVSTFAADRFNFLQHRWADNTWQIDTEEFLAGCTSVDRTAPEHVVDR